MQKSVQKPTQVPVEKNLSIISKQVQPNLLVTQSTIKKSQNDHTLMQKSAPVSPSKKLKMKKTNAKYPYQYSDIPLRKTLPDWNKSSAVLRHTTHRYSVPKAQRFPNPKIAYYNHYQIKYDSFLLNRKSTFGFGSKAKVPEIFQANHGEATKNVPFYQVDDMVLRRNKSETIKKGKTFGKSWDIFKGVRTSHRGTVHTLEQVKVNPGHKYTICPETGTNSQKNAIHERLRMFTVDRAFHKRDEPSPQDYSINQSQTKQGSLKTNFGIGAKYSFTNNPECTKVPGPIYNISGFCDKFKNTKIKNSSPIKITV